MKIYEIVRPMQWGNVPPLAEAASLSANDKACMAEIRAVLERHGCLEKFGLNLLHKPFDITDDEMLVESVDIGSRTLVTRPAPRGSISPSRVVETQWRLTDEKASVVCNSYCLIEDGRHQDAHAMREI
jgi:hypothetical protein